MKKIHLNQEECEIDLINTSECYSKNIKKAVGFSFLPLCQGQLPSEIL